MPTAASASLLNDMQAQNPSRAMKSSPDVIDLTESTGNDRKNKRPSPDSVQCIDLTEDDNDILEERLGDVRTTLQEKIEAKTSACARSTKKTPPHQDRQPIISQPANPNKRMKVKHEPVHSSQLTFQALARRITGSDSDVRIVEQEAPAMVPAGGMASSANENAADEVVLMGSTNQVRLPHMRQHCTEYRFDATGRK